MQTRALAATREYSLRLQNLVGFGNGNMVNIAVVAELDCRSQVGVARCSVRTLIASSVNVSPGSIV